MALPAGTRLGPYQVGAQIGVGGMGEVYRARDTKLDRDVAIKVLPESFVADPERVARFQREARTLAALNHPNIGGIHGLEEDNGVAALVLELVEGPTLADRIAQGPIPLDDALPIADQIVSALHAAHEQGIVHRDLKPANIKIRPDGSVKVLDFGLAKTIESTGVMSPGRSTLPTITTPAHLRQGYGGQAMTEMGVVLGTAAYMSPEQAKGRPADKRSDIWSFGCVLFEMLTGRRPFASDDDTVTEVVAAVLKTEPDWHALPAETPAAMHRLLRRCLAKNPHARLHDIADARLEIAEAGTSDAVVVTSARPPSRLAWGIAAALAAVCVILAFLLQRSARQPGPSSAVYRTVILPPALEPTAVAEARTGLPRFTRGVALSPNGERLAFVAPGAAGVVMLWVRELAQLAARPLTGTEGASSPFWSPDGRQIGFVADRKLKRIEVEGGHLTTLYDGAQPFATGSWNRDGIILFAGGASILRIPAAGGTASKVTSVGGETFATTYFLPDGRRFLYSAASAGATTAPGIYVGSLDSDERTKLRDDGLLPASGSGFLLFVRDDMLMAQRFDPDTLALTGDVVPLADGLRFGGPQASRATFAISHTGVLVYQTALSEQSDLVWADRAGKILSTVSEPRDFSYVQLSPDDRHVAISRVEDSSRNRDLWLYDTTRRGQIRLTDQPADDFAPLWSPLGDRIAFIGRRDADKGLNLYEISARGDGLERRLVEREGLEIPTSWSPDGRFILFQSEAPASDIFAVRLEDSTVAPFVNTRYTEASAQFSPDGRWVAYSSNQTGRIEVYVAPFQRAGRMEPISTDGGGSPRWRNDGKELFYIRRDNMLMAVPVRLTESSIEVGEARELFRTPFRNNALPYDVSRDGRFLINRSVDDQAPVPITLVVNWPALLSK